MALAGAPQRILDLGAGTGLLACRLRQAFPEAELTLLDAAGRMLAQARRRLGEQGVRYLEAALEEPLPTGVGTRLPPRWPSTISTTPRNVV